MKYNKEKEGERERERVGRRLNEKKRKNKKG
jgi:hypothetical protein